MNQNSNEVTVLEVGAVFTGCLVPLDDVPDPVFAGRMVGDGISIDPLSDSLVSPCDGKVVQIHEAKHAITIQALRGLEVLIHIGVDTVKLKGEGFVSHVREGDLVKAGEKLISFDMDFVGRNAKSLLTQVLLIPSDEIESIRCSTGLVKAAMDPMFTIHLRKPGASVKSDSMAVDSLKDNFPAVLSAKFLVPNPSGLHARPSAVIASKAKGYSSTVSLIRGGSRVNAKSVTAVMRLDVKMNDEIMIEAQGPDSELASAEIAALIREGAGELDNLFDSSVSDDSLEAFGEETLARILPPGLTKITGVAVSPGLVLGTIYRFKADIPVYSEQGQGPEVETQRLQAAIDLGSEELLILAQNISENVDESEAEIFEAHKELLSDPMLVDDALISINDGLSAEAGWHKSIEKHAEQLERLSNELLKARAADIRDIGLRVLKILTGVSKEQQELPSDSIIIAHELTPSDTATLDRNKVVGFCTIAGGATSHSAILARSLSLPAVSGVPEYLMSLENGTKVILDGNVGLLYLDPSEEQIQTMENTRRHQEMRHIAHMTGTFRPSFTTDSEHISVVSNIASLDDARKSFALGSEGVGLLRSEFLFMGRRNAPTEEQQYEVYEGIAKFVGTERYLTIRTLDIGGDKPLPYISVPAEDNPFLGERGIRLCLGRPSLFRPHLRAILRVSHLCKLQIMLPMISSLDEFFETKEIIAGEVENLKAEGYSPSPFALGIMVEVPSVAIRAMEFAREVDFLSIGTNDLSQYTVAMDRGHRKLSAKLSPLDPAVLELIWITAEAGKAFHKTVSICGGMASDSLLVPLLIGLGIRKLSVAGPSLPSVKAAVRRFSIDECENLAYEALRMHSADKIRSMLLEKAGE
jgi:phosphocarrier protein FPr